MRHSIFLLLLSISAAASAPPAEKRIVFLGDSITQAGGYLEIIEAALITRHPDVKYDFLPIGLASETLSGLSEPGHAGGSFPRPNLHERLGRVLEKAKPQLVFACYGMNDGIYYPFSPERSQAYQDGMRKLREKVQAAGARIVHLTPPVFDPMPIKENLLGDGLAEYPKPWQGYNTVLDTYSDWLLSQRQHQWEVLDIHGPMNASLAEHRKTDVTFTFAKDGVHPGPQGHRLMAQPILEVWGLKANADGTPVHPDGPAILRAVQKKQALLKPAWLSHTGHLRPGTGAGLPLPEAESQAGVFDTEARRLARNPATK